MLRIGRHKDEQRRINIHHALNDRKAVKSRHLNVEKHQIRFQRFNLADGLTTVVAGRDDFDVVERLQP